MKKSGSDAKRTPKPEKTAKIEDVKEHRGRFSVFPVKG